MDRNMQVCEPSVSAYAYELDQKKVTPWHTVSRWSHSAKHVMKNVLKNAYPRRRLAIRGRCKSDISIVACRTRNTTSRHRLLSRRLSEFFESTARPH